MAPHADESPALVTHGRLPLLRVCRLPNEAGAKYRLCGDQACILHGLVRTAEDVDILEDLIASQETYREQDALDRMRLQALRRRDAGDGERAG